MMTAVKFNLSMIIEEDVAGVDLDQLNMSLDACYSEHWQVTRFKKRIWATVKTNKQGKLAEQEKEKEREDKHKCEKTRCQVMGCCCNPNICFFRCFQDTDKGILWPLAKQLSDTAWY